MRSLATLLLLFLLGTKAAPAQQNDQARYTAFVEILGNAGIASLNADVVYDNGYGFRIGGFADPTPLFDCDDGNLQCRSRRGQDLDRDREPNPTVYLVVMGHRLLGASAHKLELGVGVLVGHVEPDVANFLPRAALTATVGYRLQPKIKRPGFRVGFTPIIGIDRVLLRPGFSVSYGLPTPR
jgi:hypothetical protein